MEKIKDIKEYLPFYLGHRVALCNSGSWVYNRVLVAVGGIGDEPYCKLRLRLGDSNFVHSVLLKESENIKPLLRPLSKLTIEDSIEIVTEAEVLTSDCFTFLNNFINDKSRCSFITAKKLIDGLRKYGYDADDLIPEGLALDITTQKI